MEVRIFDNADEIAVAASEMFVKIINDKNGAVLGLVELAAFRIDVLVQLLQPGNAVAVRPRAVYRGQQSLPFLRVGNALRCGSEVLEGGLVPGGVQYLPRLALGNAEALHAAKYRLDLFRNIVRGLLNSLVHLGGGLLCRSHAVKHVLS